MRYGMVIDPKALLSGCKTCSVVCKVAQQHSQQHYLESRSLEGGNAPDTARSTWDNPEMQHWPWPASTARTRPDQECARWGATWKDEQTDIVRQDYYNVHRLPHVLRGRLLPTPASARSTGRNRLRRLRPGRRRSP